jgi:hypothetical protein
VGWDGDAMGMPFTAAALASFLLPNGIVLRYISEMNN